MAFIPSTALSYDADFLIKSIDFSFANDSSRSDKSQSASIYGLDANTPLVVGDLYESNVSLTWVVERPISKQILSGTLFDVGFSGFDIFYYDINRNLLYQNPFSIKDTNFSINSIEIAQLFNQATGNSGFLNLSGKFFIDVVSSDYENNRSTGVALVDFGIPQISISGYSLTDSVSLNLDSNDSHAIDKISIFATTGSQFQSLDDPYFFTLDVPGGGSFLSSISIPNFFLNSTSNDTQQDNSISRPFYLHLIPYGYFATGQIVSSSGIKLNSYALDSLPYKIQDLTGYVRCDLNNIDKKLNLETFITWDKFQGVDTLVQAYDFHVLVEESGVNKNNYDYYVSNFSPKNIQGVFSGSGTGLTRYSDVFEPYSQSGIKWCDHTIYVDNFGSLPANLYDQYVSGINYISQIVIPSGFSNSSEVFLSYAHTGNNSFSFLPSGGLFENSQYTGTY